jgi:site-specific DNA recombinase
MDYIMAVKRQNNDNESVFAYLRVSSAGQIDGNGFDRQLDTIENFCASHGFKIKQIFQEAVSGTTDEMDRPEFSKMISASMSNGCKIIIIERLDRLAREYRIQESLLIYLTTKGIDLYSAATAENVTKAISEDPMKKALVQIQGIFHELDKSLLVNKLKKARDKIRNEKGRCEGKRAYGSLPGEKEVIKRIRIMRRKPRGSNRKRRSFKSIADLLNEESIRTRQNKKWTASLVYNAITTKEK